jgi:hypothetical protein
MFFYSTGYYVSPPDDQYLKFKNRCSLVCMETDDSSIVIIRSRTDHPFVWTSFIPIFTILVLYSKINMANK